MITQLSDRKLHQFSSHYYFFDNFYAFIEHHYLHMYLSTTELFSKYFPLKFTRKQKLEKSESSILTLLKLLFDLKLYFDLHIY